MKSRLCTTLYHSCPSLGVVRGWDDVQGDGILPVNGGLLQGVHSPSIRKPKTELEVELGSGVLIPLVFAAGMVCKY